MRHVTLGIGALWLLACAGAEAGAAAGPGAAAQAPGGAGASAAGSGGADAGGLGGRVGAAAVGGSGSSGMRAPSGGSAGPAGPGGSAGLGGSAGPGGALAGGTGGAGAGRSGSGAAGNSGAGGVAAVGCSGLFCEDFETGQLDPSVWTKKQVSTGNSVTVQNKQVAHGQYAAQFHAKGGTDYSLILHDGLPSALQKHYFGRLYFYASDFPSESGGHTAYIWSSNGLEGFPYEDHHLEVASYHESTQVVWQTTYWTGNGPEYIGTGGKIPQAKWFCLEWELNDAPDQIAIWVDGDAKQGAAFRNINNGASGLLGKLTSLGLGFRTWHPDGAPDIDIYIDDVVLDTERVGCL